MLQIEIFSDVICPWCFIGKRRLDQVLQSELGDGITLRWRPYLLYPNLPEEGMDRLELLTRRYGAAADPGKVPERILEEAGAEGIELRFDLIKRTPNTLQAHRLLEFAQVCNVQQQLSERLFLAYFCEGKDVGNRDVLVALANEVGMDEKATSTYLAGQEGTAAVREQLSRAPELGISGVPGYYLADSFLLPGAQTSEVMGQIITRVKDRLLSRQAET